MTVEELQVLITANSTALQKEIQGVKNQLGGLTKHTSKMGSTMTKSFILGGIALKGLGMALRGLTSNMGDAVSRLDTLNNYPRVMSNLGISTEDANASMQKLSDKLVGLPTTLDEAVSSVQKFTSANGNVKASTDMFLALNNAILSGGASTEIQKSALEQLSQAYAKGKPDMMEWRTAMTAMPAQMKQVAMAMGYVSADALGESLRSGKVSMNDFMRTINQLNTQGYAGFKSFEEQALNSTGGVRTSMINVKTAITRGLAEIMNAIGQSNIAGFFQRIARAINSAVPYIAGFVKACVWAVSSITALFGGKTKSKVAETTKSIANAGKSMGGFGGSAGESAKGMDKATGSAKKLKKELNGLASFDEMNVLKDANADNGGGGGGGGGADGGGAGDLGDWDLSGWDDALDGGLSKADQVAEKIKQVFAGVGKVLRDIWNSEPIQAFSNFAVTYGQFLWNFWKTLGTDLYNNIVMTWGNIQGNVSTIFTNMSTLFTQMFIDMAVGIETWGQPIIDGVSGIFNSIWKDAVDPVVQLITKVWADFSGILVTLWNKHGKPLINNIGEFATKTIALFQSIWDNIIEPIITPFLDTLSWLWNKHLKGLVKEIGDFIGELVNGALAIYNKFIQPIIMWLIQKLAPAWSTISSLVIGVMGTIGAVVSDVIGGVIRVLKGIIQFITGVFTGNWRKAWEGIKSIFSGIVKGLAGIFKAPINLIIDGINAFTRGLNKIKIPDWVPGVGGKGFHISAIPKLARGGIVDKPTLAEIGERGKEAIIPLENNTGWIDKLASKLNDKTGDGSPIQLVVKIGEDTILDKCIQGMRDKDFETNGEVFNI